MIFALKSKTKTKIVFKFMKFMEKYCILRKLLSCFLRFILRATSNDERSTATNREKKLFVWYVFIVIGNCVSRLYVLCVSVSTNYVRNLHCIIRYFRPLFAMLANATITTTAIATTTITTTTSIMTYCHELGKTMALFRTIKQ